MNVRVEGAALHSQTLEDAPASVTIITSEDIRKYGYRTLGEALASARGFYLSNNRTYTTVGVRGFNLPGDYASRFLVMVNGHNMADNIFNYQLFFGEDFPIDMSLIRQIEIIRGPSSALYGSNGIFATINIITQSPKEASPPTLTTDIGSFGEKKAQFSTATPLGKNANLLLSGSVFNNTGESPLFFPQFDTPQTNQGQAIGMDAEKGYHVFSNLTWGNWNIVAVFSEREKVQPISWGNTIFNDRGTEVNNLRDYVEAAYSRQLGRGTLRWRTYYDSQQFLAQFLYPLSSGCIENNHQLDDGHWVGTQISYRFDVQRVGALTIGGEGKLDLQNLQSDEDLSPVPIEIANLSHRERSLALFVQDERTLSTHWKLNVGVRWDASSYRQSSVTPRAALIYQPSSGWTYKFLYGRGFRKPSAFELYFDDGGRSGDPNPNLRPEKTDTVEVDVERKLGKRMNLVASAYGYRMRDFIIGTFNSDGVIQYHNVGQLHATGLEIEMTGRPAAWLEASASYSLQRSVDDVEKAPLENSPVHLAKLHIAVPLGRKFDLSSGMQYYSSRLTLDEASVKPVYLADFTVTSHRLLPNFDVRSGLRNAFSRNYSDPIALNPLVDTMQQPGRTFFVELIVHGGR
jgi:outer membrane receptor for ferrienterochelin and colicins